MILAFVVAGCGGRSSEPVLYSAASLTDVAPGLIDGFDAAGSGASFDLNVGGSSTLAFQIQDGAPGGVFLAADESTMDLVVSNGNAGEPVVFARNRLVLVRHPGASVDELSDLAEAELLVGLCAPSVPCGALARSELAERGITPSADTEEPDVRSLLAKVVAGELDAALVYATDARAAGGRVEVVESDLMETTPYLAAVVGDEAGPDSAAFIEFLTSASAQDVLADAGFEAP